MAALPAVDLLRDLLERQLRAIESSGPGVREGADPEDLHRFRVAGRRSRALIRAARPLIRDQLAGVDRELRWLGSLSGPVRDLDVLLEHLSELLEDLEPDQAGAEAVIVALERERLAQRQPLLRTLESERYRELLRRFAAVLPELYAADDALSLRRLAEKEFERLRTSYEALGANPPDDDLHALRIKAKHARYAAELAARTGSRALAELAETLRELQDVIGSHQDAVVAERRVRALATDGSALAVGRIVEHERARRVEARRQVPAVWKRIRNAAAQAF
jgi:CHAD domain-containing protein